MLFVVFVLETIYSNFFDYRYKLSIHIKSNSTTTQNFVQINFLLNTDKLVSDGKLNQECTDLVFVKTPNNGSFEASRLDHWIESGCNSEFTTFWIDVGDVGANGQDLIMYFGSTTSNNFQIGWDGAFVTFTASDSCSTNDGNWEFVQDVEDRFIRGHSNFGSYGGVTDSLHYHPSGIFTAGLMVNEVNGSAYAGSQTLILSPLGEGSHGHPYSLSTTSDVVLPLYYTFPFCESEKLDLFKNIVVLFDKNATYLDEDFVFLEELDGRFPRGGVKMGPAGGSLNHSHGVEEFNIGNENPYPDFTICNSGPLKATGEYHFHEVIGSVVKYSSNIPPYLTMVYGKVNIERSYPKAGMIVGATRIPPMGWTQFYPLQYKFPLGSRVYGISGGENEHVHKLEGFIGKVISKMEGIDNSTISIDINIEHQHYINSISTSSNHIPEYMNYLFVKKKESFEVDVSIDHPNELYIRVLGLEDLWWLLLLTSFVGFFIGIVIVVGCVIVFYLIIFYKQRKTLKKIDQIEDFDLILQEHQMERVGSKEISDKTKDGSPNFKINKKMFEIDVKALKIIKKIGKGGGEAVVYQAEYAGQIVGYKCFKVNDNLEEDKFAEFEKEVEIIASISFPFIISFIGATLSKNRIGIVMEFAENGDLHNFLVMFKEKNKISYPMFKKYRMLYEISSALAFLHSKKIIHRDIKLENVLVKKNETTRLMDFGLSKLYQTDQTKTKRVGTAHYMAPEVVLSGKYDNKCDVYSFSILTYIVLTENYSPYGGSSFGIESKVAKDHNFRPSLDGYKELISNDLKKFIVRNWDENPSLRMNFIEISDFLKKQCSPSSFRVDVPSRIPPSGKIVDRVETLEKTVLILQQQLKKQNEVINMLMKNKEK